MALAHGQPIVIVTAPRVGHIVAQAAELCPVSRLFAGAHITIDARLAEV
jgi:hypothetical protein